MQLRKMLDVRVNGGTTFCNRLYVFIARTAGHIDIRFLYETRIAIESQKDGRRNWKRGAVHLVSHSADSVTGCTDKHK
jgi:hypothetical protein